MGEGLRPVPMDPELARALTSSRDVRPVHPGVKISLSERKAAPTPDSTDRAVERLNPDEELRRELIPPAEEGGEE